MQAPAPASDVWLAPVVAHTPALQGQAVAARRPAAAREMLAAVVAVVQRLGLLQAQGLPQEPVPDAEQQVEQ